MRTTTTWRSWRSVRARSCHPQGAVGLYHLAWEVDSIDALAAAIEPLVEMGALVGASDHGATKSLYGKDPDGIEFEILWRVPREDWGEWENSVTTRPLDLQAELARFGKQDLLDSAAGQPV